MTVIAGRRSFRQLRPARRTCPSTYDGLRRRANSPKTGHVSGGRTRCALVRRSVESVLLEAALNGGRSPADHPAIPVSPAQLSAASRRGSPGRRRCRALSRSGMAMGGRAWPPRTWPAQSPKCASTGVPFGVSTGAWIISDPARRLALSKSGRCFQTSCPSIFTKRGRRSLPPYFLGRMWPRGRHGQPVGAERLVQSGLRKPMPPDHVRAPGAGNLPRRWRPSPRLRRFSTTAASRRPRLLHGVDATAWPLVDVARARGYGTRIGLEDTLTLPDGAIAPGNGESGASRAASLGSPRARNQLSKDCTC